MESPLETSRVLKRLRDSRKLPVCDHVPAQHAAARADTCEECGRRINLRVCATCGHVGCCDSQYGHAHVHFHETGHAVMRAKTGVGQGFIWCYVHDRHMGERGSEAV